MRKSKFTEEQIIGFLKQAEAGLAVAEICRKGGFSDATFYRWRANVTAGALPARLGVANPRRPRRRATQWPPRPT